jgi:hypothetical protein
VRGEFGYWVFEGDWKLAHWRQAVDQTGYDGPIEMELFNEEAWKSGDDQLIDRIQRRFVEYI